MARIDYTQQTGPHLRATAVDATVFPGGTPITATSAAVLEAQYGFPLRHQRGRSAAEMVEAADRGEIDVLWSSGGNFLDTPPDPRAVEAALARLPLRVPDHNAVVELIPA